jgi:hypothetical protein
MWSDGFAHTILHRPGKSFDVVSHPGSRASGRTSQWMADSLTDKHQR